MYNKGDVLIAILIIIVAAVVIYSRVGVIMDYSENGARERQLLPPLTIENIRGWLGLDKPAEGADGQGGAYTEPESAAPAGTENEPAAPLQSETPAEEEPADPEPAAAALPDDTPAEPPGSPAEVTITINAGDSASVIADKLLAAGAIDDRAAFLSEVVAKGADSKLKQGTFNIPAGSTISDIIAILVG